MTLCSGSHLLGREPSAKKTKLTPPPVPFLHLDDPVLEGIKCHLTIGDRIGFEPISRRFARIAFYMKDRMELKLGGIWATLQRKAKRLCQFRMKRKNDENDFPFVIAFNDMGDVLHALFLRIRRWHSIDFTGHNCTDRVLDLLTGQLLAVALDESRTVIDIRRFSCRLKYAPVKERVAEFLHRCAPVLRRLSFDLVGSELLPVLVQAIGTCQELRCLTMSGSYPEQLPMSFLPALLGLKKLNGLLVGYYQTDGAVRHCLSIDDRWLSRFARRDLHPLLENMRRLIVARFWDDLLAVADLLTIVSKMCSPVCVELEHGYMDWPVIWNDILRIVHSTRAIVLITQDGGLPAVTLEQFAAGLSSLPPSVQTSFISPDIQNAPVDKLNRYNGEVEFRFSSGGLLTVRSF